MATLNRFFILFLCATLAMFLQRGGFLNAWGIVPNLVLLMVAIALAVRERSVMIYALYAAMLIAAFVMDPFWLGDLLILGVVVVILTLLHARGTGNAFVDLMLMVAVGELLFYGAKALLGISPFLPMAIAFEFLYTVLFGLPLLLIIKRWFL